MGKFTGIPKDMGVAWVREFLEETTIHFQHSCLAQTVLPREEAAGDVALKFLIFKSEVDLYSIISFYRKSTEIQLLLETRSFSSPSPSRDWHPITA
ncbi:hypothetical protein P8C59_006224 [Phyllachora maydis]|uniref:Uncharacterized protein n=1 Tax=Phyllachora maydis TaxID=1825666 RepID=A0AAD9I6G4_9PEZI|nr:hypothetical protein P8C59_006224 [Phyllachora maydis]